MQHYRELETEAEGQLPSDPKPDEPWPAAGAVSFENVQLRYRPDLPLVLKGLTFDVKPGEKVGIIGRTGAGKSSIAQALFRTVELCEGKIEVDWDSDGETITLVWRELGTPCETPDTPSSGFGQRMIAMSVRADLSGTIERDWRPDGLTATLSFPVEA